MPWAQPNEITPPPRPRRAGPSRVGVPMLPGLPVRMPPALHAAVSEAARIEGVTSAAWVRSVLADRLSLDDVDDRQPVQAYGGAGPDLAALTALRMQLHELGGLLVQVAKVSRQEGQVARHAEAEATLADVREAIGMVAMWQDLYRRGAS